MPRRSIALFLAAIILAPILWAAASLMLFMLRLPVAEDALEWQADRMAAYIVQEKQVPALAIAELRNGKAVFAVQYGVSDVSTKTPVTDETLFEAASLTKPVIATIAMRLYDQGVFDLDERVI